MFVTSAGVNPTTTICAVASMIADKLIERRSHLTRPELSSSFAVGSATVAPVIERVPVALARSALPSRFVWTNSATY